jgi:hypothetical protein
MFCPEVILLNGRWGYVTRHEGADYMRREYVPLKVWINPLRLEIGIGRGRPCRFVINRDGRLHRKLSDFTWRLWRRRRQ